MGSDIRAWEAARDCNAFSIPLRRGIRGGGRNIGGDSLDYVVEEGWMLV